MEAMGGDVEGFRELWLTAGAPDGGTGRGDPDRGEVRRAGGDPATPFRPRGPDAGGRGGRYRQDPATTTSQRMATVGTVVVRGNCLPLSSEVPLLPVAELLRAVHQRDDGQSLKEALADCAPYVPRAIARLVPEIADSPESLRDADHGWERQWLFAAIGGTSQPWVARVDGRW